MQRLLSTSGSIKTHSEPWLALPLYYSIMDDGCVAEYNFNHFRSARDDIEGKTGLSMRKHISSCLKGIYEELGGEHEYYLDKTPRYSLIVNYLIEDFPDAKFIFMWRNPLAVASSISNTWFSGRWKVHHFNVDLYSGFKNAIDTYSNYKDSENVISINYESLVEGSETKRLEAFLGVDLSLEQAIDTVIEGKMGDPSGQYMYKSLNRSSVDKWMDDINSMQRKQWCKKYIYNIGQDRLAIIGLDFDTILKTLNNASKAISIIDLFDCSLGKIHALVSPEFNIKRFVRWFKSERVFDYR